MLRFDDLHITAVALDEDAPLHANSGTTAKTGAAANSGILVMSTNSGARPRARPAIEPP